VIYGAIHIVFRDFDFIMMKPSVLCTTATVVRAETNVSRTTAATHVVDIRGGGGGGGDDKDDCDRKCSTVTLYRVSERAFPQNNRHLQDTSVAMWTNRLPLLPMNLN